MTQEELKIIDQFIEGFEPWKSNLEFMDKLKAEGSYLKGCFYCGIEPDKVKELKEAVEHLRELLPLNK